VCFQACRGSGLHENHKGKGKSIPICAFQISVGRGTGRCPTEFDHQIANTSV
jgi:hypothetical protein